MSTIVTLDTVWLNDAADPSDKVQVRSVKGLTRTASVEGRIQRVAGGGARLIRRAGTLASWSLDAPWATRDEVEWIEAHIGRTVTARDHRGHKVHVVYLEVPVDENGVTVDGGLSLDLSEVSYDEKV